MSDEIEKVTEDEAAQAESIAVSREEAEAAGIDTVAVEAEATPAEVVSDETITS